MNNFSNTLKQNKMFLFLAGIIFVGAWLRLYHINFQSLWYDELHSIIPTAPDKSFRSIIEYCKSDQPPFFFLYIHYVFKLFGYNEVVGRIAAAVIGILGIPVLYLLGKEIDDSKTGLVAAALVAINYFHIDYSQELRFYSMAFLLSALSYLFFIRAYKYSKLSDFAFYISVTVALLYTHYYGLVIFGVQAITFLLLVVFNRKDLKFIIAGLSSGIIIILAFIPWIPVIINDLGIGSFWIQRPKPFFILDYFYSYFGKDVVTTAIFFAFIVLFFRKVIKNHEAAKRPLELILIIWLVLSYLVPYVKSLVGVPMLHIRYTIITLPAWFLIFAIGWNQIKGIKWKYSLVFLIMVAAIGNLFFFRKQYTKIRKQQFREASEMVQLKNEEHFPIISAYPWHFNFYFTNYSAKVYDIHYNLSEVDKFWLLQVEFFTPTEKQEEIKLFTDTFQVAEQYSFYKADALLMVRKNSGNKSRSD